MLCSLTATLEQSHVKLKNKFMKKIVGLSCLHRKITWLRDFLPFYLSLILFPQITLSQEIKRISLDVKDEVISVVMNKLGEAYGKNFFYSEESGEYEKESNSSFK